MSQSNRYDHDDRDHNNNSNSQDADCLPGNPDTEVFDGTNNEDSRDEATFDPHDTTILLNPDAANTVELDPSLLSYGTNFNKLLAQDPVHRHIMRLVETCAWNLKIPVYAKVNFVKLAAINKAKASNITDMELASFVDECCQSSSAQQQRKTSRWERV
jgi:hypothetical protein